MVRARFSVRSRLPLRGKMSDAELELAFSEEELELIHDWERKPNGGTVLGVKKALAELASHVPKKKKLTVNAELTDAHAYFVRKYVEGQRVEWNTLGEAVAAALFSRATRALRAANHAGNGAALMRPASVGSRASRTPER